MSDEPNEVQRVVVRNHDVPIKSLNKIICFLSGLWRSLWNWSSVSGCDYFEAEKEVPALVTVLRCAVCGDVEVLWEDHEQFKELLAESEQWKTWGVVEIAVRNANVAEYMKHWEERATKAECELELMTEQRDSWEARSCEQSMEFQRLKRKLDLKS